MELFVQIPIRRYPEARHLHPGSLIWFFASSSSSSLKSQVPSSRRPTSSSPRIITIILLYNAPASSIFSSHRLAFASLPLPLLVATRSSDFHFHSDSAASAIPLFIPVAVADTAAIPTWPSQGHQLLRQGFGQLFRVNSL